MSKLLKYLELIKTVQDPHGFIESHECDSLGYTALAACDSRVKVDITAAFHNGRWHRRPINSDCCGCWDSNRPENKVPYAKKLQEAIKEIVSTRKIDQRKLSKILSYKGSTISRDMLVMLAWYAWAHKRLDISESVIKYAVKHFGRMGEGDPARTGIRPALFSTYCWISYKLGGPSRPWARLPIFNISAAKLDDYRAHLQVLHIVLRRKVTGKTTKKYEKILSWQYKRQPQNPLFAIACGDYSAATNMMLDDDKYWPQDRLPTTHDRSTQWLPMRDCGDDWLPDKGEAKTHSGGDLIFLNWLILHLLSD
jgi:hypothetical protein